jgi:S-formylglutathione hydrolase FrmB
MAFLQVQYYSSVLNVCSTVNVILPEADQGIGVDASKAGKLPKVLYLLHGYSDDHSIWMRRTSVERYAAQHNLAVIMPAVNHSFYNNEVYGERYWDYISDELPKVLYLLHGYSDDHSIWMRRTSVERYAAEHHLAVIMPAVNHSFYTNEVQGERYWDYISEELPRAMHRFFRLSDKPEDTFVAGLSMGGYGAMKLALTHPERFGAAASFCGAPLWEPRDK